VPLRWDGDVDDLPGGYSDSLARGWHDYDAWAAADTLVICAAQVRPGSGTYVIPEALAPLHVDRAADNGVLTDPASGSDTADRSAIGQRRRASR
jgi:hypothetical protein